MAADWESFKEWLQSMMQSPNGMLINRALRKEKSLQIGFALTFDDVYADEFSTMLVLDQERNLFESEKNNGQQ